MTSQKTLHRVTTASVPCLTDQLPYSYFVQESVGQHLFLMVSALTQQTAKGPVDCVTEKALYTLSEDWLLWQAQDFSFLVQTHTYTNTHGLVSCACTCESVHFNEHQILSSVFGVLVC